MVFAYMVAGGFRDPDLSLAMRAGGVGLPAASQPIWIDGRDDGTTMRVSILAPVVLVDGGRWQPGKTLDLPREHAIALVNARALNTKSLPLAARRAAACGCGLNYRRGGIASSVKRLSPRFWIPRSVGLFREWPRPGRRPNI